MSRAHRVRGACIAALALALVATAGQSAAAQEPAASSRYLVSQDPVSQDPVSQYLVSQHQVFVPPLPLVIVTPFRPAATPYGPGHRGVDLAAEAGSTVLAAADGVVVYAGRLVDRGVISIEHGGGLRTTYEPVRAGVSAGDVVRRGDPVGVVEVGHGPCAPVACLHLGARMPDRVYLDPLALFGPWHVRLKPW